MVNGINLAPGGTVEHLTKAIFFILDSIVVQKAYKYWILASYFEFEFCYTLSCGYLWSSWKLFHFCKQIYYTLYEILRTSGTKCDVLCTWVFTFSVVRIPCITTRYVLISCHNSQDDGVGWYCKNTKRHNPRRRSQSEPHQGLIRATVVAASCPQKLPIYWQREQMFI